MTVTNRSGVILRDLSNQQLMTTWEWCTQRWGQPFSSKNPRGYWTWDQLPDDHTIITLPNQAMIVELKLVEPWTA